MGSFLPQPIFPILGESLLHWGTPGIGRAPALPYIALLGAFLIAQHISEGPLPGQPSPPSSLPGSCGFLEILLEGGTSYIPIPPGRVRQSTTHLSIPVWQVSRRLQIADWPVSGSWDYWDAGVGIEIPTGTQALRNFLLGRNRPIGQHL